MYLHNDKELFQELIQLTANETGLVTAIVEKDYYVTMFLKCISEMKPEIIFKGGTSLSKCFKIINRFSEDIDLNIQFENRATEGQRKSLKAAIKKAAEMLGLEIINLDDTHSRRDFNKYEIEYETVFESDFLKQNLICETVVFFKAYPTVKLPAECFIYQYLKQIERLDIAEEYSITPFVLNVQSAERTMIDKLFALGDYYLSGNVTGHSRHIYDIACLSKITVFNDDFVELLNRVKEERKANKTCLSSQDDVSLNSVLQEIVEKDAYKSDYERITIPLLFDKIPYDAAIKALKDLLSINLIP